MPVFFLTLFPELSGFLFGFRDMLPLVLALDSALSLGLRLVHDTLEKQVGW